jgi:hypothetical protein
MNYNPDRYPYNLFRKYFASQIKNDRTNIEFFFNYTDKFIIWLIGFSIAGISLIVSDYDALRVKFSFNLKMIILFLRLSIILGVAYRVLVYLYILKWLLAI